MPPSPDIWFKAKRFGYGAGKPVRWQGWLVVAVMSASVIAVQIMVRPGHRWWAAGLLAVIFGAGLPLIARHTEGGWRWRR